MSTLKTRFAAAAAKKLRAGSTDAERKLWYRLRDRRLLGYKFVQQEPIDHYVADFACREGVLRVIAEHLAKAPSPGLRFAKPDLSLQGEVNPAPSTGIAS